jgi:hypothetical protein
VPREKPSLQLWARLELELREGPLALKKIQYGPT